MSGTISEEIDQKDFLIAFQRKVSSFFQRYLKKKKMSTKLTDEVDGALPIALKERRTHRPRCMEQNTPTNGEIVVPFESSTGHGSSSACRGNSTSSGLLSSTDIAMDASHTTDIESVVEECLHCNAMIIEYMVYVFMPTLKRNLNVVEILPYLHFISQSDAKTFSETVPQELAVQRLIDTIMEIRERGKWTTFLVALEKTGYTYLHQLLTGETEKDHSYSNELLKIMSPGLINDLHFDDIIDKLFETCLINEEDHDQVKTVEKSKGPIAATRMLLQKVDKRKTNWDTKFADVLEEAGMTQFASAFRMVEHHTHNDNPLSKLSNRKLSKGNLANRKCSIHNEGHFETAMCMSKKLSENQDVPTSDRNNVDSLSERVDEIKQELLNVNKGLISLKADDLEQTDLLQQINAKMKKMDDRLSLIEEDILSRKMSANAPEIQHNGQGQQYASDTSV